MKRSTSVKLAAAPLLAAAFLSGCGGEEETAYCADANNRVTHNVHCERANNPGFFWFFGAPGLGRAGGFFSGGS